MPEVAPLVALGAASFGVGLSGAVTPGPLLVLDIREAARRGFWAGPLVSTGHALLELAVVGALTLGLAPYLGRPIAAAVVGFLGGLVLLWMAWGMARSAGEVALVASGAPSGGTLLRPVAGGALVSVANPYWFLWWMTVGAALFSQSVLWGVAGVAAFYLGHILADYSWYSLVSFGVATGRRVMTSPVYRWVVRACALFLVGIGVYFLVSGGLFVRQALALI